MFRLYSKGCEYAIRAVLCVVQSNGSQRFLAKDICEQAKIPESFTRKVLQSLVQGGYFEAIRGPKGGYELIKSPDEISVLEFIRAVDGEDTFGGCILGLSKCRDDNPCPLHEAWASIRGRLLGQLDSMSIADLAKNNRTSEFFELPGRQAQEDGSGS
jgi:Rrf2 family protein